MDVRKVLIDATVNGKQTIDIETGCQIIQQYIKDTKGVDVIIDPMSIWGIIQMQLYNIALDTAIRYYYEQQFKTK
jgi:hypothetical protein